MLHLRCSNEDGKVQIWRKAWTRLIKSHSSGRRCLPASIFAQRASDVSCTAWLKKVKTPQTCVKVAATPRRRDAHTNISRLLPPAAGNFCLRCQSANKQRPGRTCVWLICSKLFIDGCATNSERPWCTFPPNFILNNSTKTRLLNCGVLIRLSLVSLLISLFATEQKAGDASKWWPMDFTRGSVTTHTHTHRMWPSHKVKRGLQHLLWLLNSKFGFDPIGFPSQFLESSFLSSGGS